MKKKLMSYKEAKVFVETLGLKNQKEYQAWWLINKPDNLPENFEEYYSNKLVYLPENAPKDSVDVTDEFEESRRKKVKIMKEFIVFIANSIPDLINDTDNHECKIRNHCENYNELFTRHDVTPILWAFRDMIEREEWLIENGMFVAPDGSSYKSQVYSTKEYDKLK
jgi:hypothetical protein